METSIIIPNYNGEKYIKDCLDSLSKQSFTSFEIIIVDNASIDNSINIIEENYSDIKIIEMDKNYGFSVAVNRGIKEAKGEYVVLLNNDTIVFEDWLHNLVEAIEKDSEIFSVSSKMIRYVEKDKIDDAGDEYCILAWAYKRGDGVSIERYAKDCQVFSSCAGAAIYRKVIFDEIGYFDENFFAYLEDVDISYRGNIYGYKNMYCADALVYHIGSATSGSRHNYFKVRLAARNNIYLIYKNMPIVQLIINMPFLILGHLIKYLYFIRKGLGKDYRNGIIEAFNNLKQVDKVKYKSKNLWNYLTIEVKLVINLIKIFKFR